MSKTISLCMIVKNEEQHLKTCLASVQHTVDEMIIVDTGSTDRTLEIAASFNARILHFEWIGDFAAARNYALMQATSDYILVLDADEFFEEKVDLQQVIESDLDFYMIRIRNLMENNVVYHHAIRLFRNHIGLEYYGRIHEHVNIEKYEHLTKSFAEPILTHVGYTQTMYLEKDKHQRNLKLLLQAIKEEPSGYNYFNLGRQYKANREFEKALESYQTAFHKSKERVYIVTLLVDIVECLRHLKRHEEGIRVALDAIESFPNSTDLYFALGKIYEDIEYWQDAKFYFHKCLELGEVYLTETLEGVGSYLAQIKLGEIDLRENRNLDAFEAAVKALEMKKQYVPALELYFRTLMRTRISAEDVYTNLRGAYSLTAGQDVVNLISVLYILRHPLMDRFIEDYQMNVDLPLRTVAWTFAKQYESARQSYLQLETVDGDKGPDLLLLAFLLRDEQLLKIARSLFNVNQKDWKVIEKIVRRDHMDTGKMSDQVASILLVLCRHLIVLEEYEAFDTLSSLLLQGTPKMQYDLADLLQTYGHVDGALQVLVQAVQNTSHNPDFYQMIGDLLVRKQQPAEAIGMFLKVLDLHQHHIGTYQGLYQLFVETQELESLQMVTREIKRRFPMSQWAKRL